MGAREHAKPSSRGLLLVNIGQLVTLQSRTSRPGPRRGAELKELGVIENGAVLCLGGKIVSAGRTKDALRDPWIRKNRKRLLEIDCAGKVVLPGFVDSHTHPAFVSPRLVDFEKRITGATYEQVAAAGGGIRSSVNAVRKIPCRALAERILAAFREMAGHGTTTVEAKSGYGLSLGSELKSLEAIRDAASRWPGTVITTLLGAHVVPAESRDAPDQYVELVCKKMVPQAAERKLAQFVDVFCDRGAFTARDTRKIFAAARACGLDVRGHVGQLSRTRLSEILRLQPASLDHMDHVSEDDIRLLARAESNTVATLVPGANYFLGLSDYPPARRFIDAGVPVALATDYNPGSSPLASMPFALSLACTHMKMSPAEAISAATMNGAWALRMAERKGSLEPGKDADLSVFDVADYREIPYWVAVDHCAMTIASGTMIWQKQGLSPLT